MLICYDILIPVLVPKMDAMPAERVVGVLHRQHAKAASDVDIRNDTTNPAYEDVDELLV